MGFSAWPLRCPSCDRRVTMAPRMVFGAFSRCPGCHELTFVLILPDIRAGWIAVVKASEAHDIGIRRLTPVQVLRELGAFVEAA